MINKIKFDFDDIGIEPASVTDIESRNEINLRDDNNMLPLFASPMDTVVDLSNYKIFLENGIRVVLPRTVDMMKLPYNENSEYLWFSYGLNEIDNLFLNKSPMKGSYSYDIQQHLKIKKLYILIDVANGHMKKLHDKIKLLKDRYKNIEIMAGNIANPETFKILSDIGVSMIRVTIGNGSGCHFPGTKIKTNKDYKNIENIQVGDMVLTHKGNYKEVEMIHILKSEDNYQLNDNKVTGNHEYYVVSKEHKDLITDDNIHEYAEWVRVDELNEDYFLLELE